MGMTYRVLRQMYKYNMDSKGIAAALCKSEQTVRRILAQEGTNIQALRERVRRRMLVDLLSQGKTIQCITYELGYEDDNSFYTLFTRTFNMPWMEWKRANNY